jgi:TolB-like protein
MARRWAVFGPERPLRDAAATSRRGRKLLALVLLLVVAALVSAGVHSGARVVQAWRRVSWSRDSRRRSVAILPLANRSQRPDDAWLATALDELVAVTLGRSERLRVIDGDRVSAAVRGLDAGAVARLDADTLRALRRSLDADVVVSGAYSVADAADGQLDVELQAFDGAGAGEGVAVHERGTVGGLLGVAVRVGQQLRHQLGEAALDDEDARALLTLLPANVAAARAYAEGLSRWRAGQVAAARERFDVAVARDPQSAPAQLALARALAWLGYERGAHEAAARALALAESLPHVERLAAAAACAELDGDWTRAVELRAQLWAAAPDDIDAGLRLAEAQVDAARFADALATSVQLRRLPPGPRDDPRIDLLRGRAFIGLGVYDREAAASADAQRRFRARGDELGAARAAEQWATTLALRGDCSRAVPIADRAQLKLAQHADWADANDCASVAAECLARSEPAARLLERLRQNVALAEASQRPRAIAVALAAHARALAATGARAQAREQLERALALARDVEDRLGADEIEADLARLALDDGDLAAAQRWLEDAVAATRRDGDLAQLLAQLATLAEVRARGGDVAGARRALDERRALVERLALVRTPPLADGWLAALGGDLDAAERATIAANDAARFAGDDDTLARGRLQLAELLLERGNSAAGSLASKALEALQRRGDGSDEVSAGHELLARLALQQHELPTARREVDQAVTLLTAEPRFDVATKVERTRASVERAEGNWPAAERRLRALLAACRRAHDVALELELTLTLLDGERAATPQLGAIARREAHALHETAAQHGFMLIANKAAALE